MRMMENKSIFVLFAIALVVVFGVGFLIGRPKTNQIASSDNMASHHAPPPPADNTLFNSLMGKAAPDFSLESSSGEKISLNALKGKKVVLFFSEGAMCYPGCWDQIDAFGEDEKKFADKDTIVLTIVVDPKADWDAAVKQDPKLAKETVLLDRGGKVSSAYGALTVTSSMHRGQFPGHTYVVLDREGMVRYLLDDESMLVRNKELLAELGKI